VIGAVVRDGDVLFPNREFELRAGDRVILLAETKRVGTVERAL
jgi:Trk K+ transport system NAD-binding subunit